MQEQPYLTVYSRRGCHLCEVLLGELETLVRGRADIRVLDIDQSADLRDLYGSRVPVVTADSGLLCEFELDQNKVLDWLNATTT